jgi:hypothetical protein
MRARISWGYWPSALLPTPFDDDEDEGFGFASDWALAPLHARSNSSTHTLGNVRMRYRPIFLEDWIEACARPRLLQSEQLLSGAGLRIS